MRKYLSDALFWAASAALTLLVVWFMKNTVLGGSIYAFVNASPIGWVISLAIALIWMVLLVTNTNIGDWVGSSGWRFTAGIIVIAAVIMLPWGKYGMLAPLVPVLALEALAANLVPDDLRPSANAEPAPPTPPTKQETADAQPTVMRYLTGLTGISLMEEEMYEVRGVTAAYGGDQGYLDLLYPAGDSNSIRASDCLPQVGISTDWVKLTNASGWRCGEGVEARCVKRNADYCQPPVTATP